VCPKMGCWDYKFPNPGSWDWTKWCDSNKEPSFGKIVITANIV